MFSLIDRYIVKEWLKTMFVAVMLIMGILILEDMYKYLKTFLEKGASLPTLVTYYVFMVPNCFHTILPIAFFISVLYVLNDMQVHNEMVALRAAGLTIFRITRAFWGIAFGLMLCMIFFNTRLLPYTANRMQMIVNTIDYNDQKRRNLHPDDIGLSTHLSFYNNQDRRLWFFSRFSFYTHKGSYASLYLLGSDHRESERIEAKEVRYDDFYQAWIFSKGRRWIFEKDHYEPTRFVPFDTYAVKCSDTPQLMQATNKLLKHLKMNELKLILNSVVANNEHFLEHRLKYYSILSSQIVFFIIVLLSIPFSLMSVRSNAMVGISKAVGLFFLYYVLNSVCHILGSQGILKPLMAAWLPNLLMFIIGCTLYRRLAPQ